MRDNHLELFIKITVSMAIGLFLLSGAIFRFQVASRESLRYISAITTILVLFWTFYVKYGWKLPVLKLMLYKPNLNGTWIGCFKSDWKNDHGQPMPVSPIVLVIRQTFINIHITAITKTFISHSYGESFLFNNSSKKRRVIYLYSNNPLQPNHEQDRHGSCELNVYGHPENELVGTFWTYKKTNGFIKARHVSRKHFEAFEQAKAYLSEESNWRLLD